MPIKKKPQLSKEDEKLINLLFKRKDELLYQIENYVVLKQSWIDINKLNQELKEVNEKLNSVLNRY